MYVPSRAFLGAEGTNERRSWNSWYRSGAQVWFCLFQTVDSTQRSSFLPSQDFCPSYFHQEMVLGGELSEIACALLDVAQTFIEGGGDCLLLPALCQNLSALLLWGYAILLFQIQPPQLLDPPVLLPLLLVVWDCTFPHESCSFFCFNMPDALAISPLGWQI